MSTVEATAPKPDPFADPEWIDVKVLPPCTCTAVKWFLCWCAGPGRHRPTLATYRCHRLVMRDDINGWGLWPSQEDLDYIWAKHPGTDLIY